MSSYCNGLAGQKDGQRISRWYLGSFTFFNIRFSFYLHFRWAVLPLHWTCCDVFLKSVRVFWKESKEPRECSKRKFFENFWEGFDSRLGTVTGYGTCARVKNQFTASLWTWTNCELLHLIELTANPYLAIWQEHYCLNEATYHSTTITNAIRNWCRRHRIDSVFSSKCETDVKVDGIQLRRNSLSLNLVVCSNNSKQMIALTIPAAFKCF